MQVTIKREAENKYRLQIKTGEVGRLAIVFGEVYPTLRAAEKARDAQWEKIKKQESEQLSPAARAKINLRRGVSLDQRGCGWSLGAKGVK